MAQQWMTFGLMALGTVFVLIIAPSWIFARWWCKPKREPPARTPENFGLPGESIEFTSGGVPIRGWLLPSASNSPLPPVIVLVHGWSRNAAELLPLAGLIQKAGFAVLLYDARGHGLSGEDGPITIRKFAEDILAAIEYLEGRSDVDTNRIGVFGRSIGGSSAILAAASDRRIRAVACCSAFADPEALTKDTLRMLHIPSWPFVWLVSRFIERWLGTAMRQVSPKNQIGRIEAPILLIHGQADRYIKPANVETLYALAPSEHKERILIPGRGHSDVLRDARSRHQIVDFFRRYL